MTKRIFLIGYMGSGKTTVGGVLAKRIGARFIDMDQEIETTEQMPIRKIFMLYGEHEFRNKESELLDKLCHVKSAVDVLSGGTATMGKTWKPVGKYAEFGDIKEDLVVSCGGGIILDDLNRMILKNQSTIFLQGDPQLLFERVKNDHNRPNAFMDIEDEQERSAQFVQRYEQRKPHYEEAARFWVNIDAKSPEEIADELFSLPFPPTSSE